MSFDKIIVDHTTTFIFYLIVSLILTLLIKKLHSKLRLL